MDNAIEIKNLSKSFRGMYAVNGLNMTVPVGAIYGFIGENGSGKSTTQKLICGHLVKDCGEIKLFGKDYTDSGVRVRVGALIENVGCFPGSSVYQNLKMQAINLNIENKDEEIQRVLKIVRMDDSANIKFKTCSLGMKQRIGIAMALLGNPALLILDEPINGLDIMVFSTAVLLTLIGLGVTFIIYAGVMHDLYQKGNEFLVTEEKKPKSKLGWLYGIIMIAATIAFFIWSFIGNAWEISWICFPIGGLLCGIVGIIDGVITKKE